MDKKPKIQPQPGHRLVTRRDFVAQGLIEASSFMVLPSLLDMILNPGFLEAAECPVFDPANLNNPNKPFILIDLAGGANLPHAFVPRVGSNTGAPLAGGAANIRGISQAYTPDMTFGIPMNPGAGALNNMRQGMLNVMAASTQANTRGGLICTESENDTSNNTLSAVQLIAAAGLKGSLVSSILGSGNRLSGGNSEAPPIAGARAPLVVQNATNVAGAVAIGGALATMSAAQKQSVLRAVQNLSKTQQAKLSGMTLAQQYAELSDCGYTQSLAFAGADFSAQVNPVANAAVPAQNTAAHIAATAVYQLANTAAVAGVSQANRIQRATVVFNALQGASGPGVITIGGCDYHNNGRNNTDAKDLEIGTEIGRVLELAARLNKEVLVGVITDGGIAANAGSPEFANDSRGGALGVMMHYSPAGPNIGLNNRQIGFYNTAFSVDRTTFVGALPQRLAYTMAINWLAINNRVADMSKIVSATEVPVAQYDQLLLFKP